MLWYRVQIGAYALKKSAEKVSVDLIEKGFKTSISKEGLLYKVRVGSFQDKSKAEKLLKRVHEHKKYRKAKILEWNDGKDLPIIDISEGKEPEKEQSYHPVIKFVAPWFTETCESKFGDAEFFIEYEKNGIDISFVILVDTGMYGCDTIKKLKKFGVKSNTPIYVVISHAHGDHYGYLDVILKEFNVVHLYLPGIDGLKKYQPSYAKAIQNQEKKAKKKGIPVTYLTTAGYFEVGHIRCDCVYQVPAERLPEHDGHKFVNNQSILTLFTLDRHGRVLLTGDLSNPGNKIVMSRVASELLAADICKCGWHGDGNAMTTEWAKYIGATWWFWNYHHNESRGGRGNTRKKIEKAGYSVLRNYEDGDIWFDYYDGAFVLNTSKKTFKDVAFKARKR